jgi:beta-lactamase superfamily II metal-dependent hydrolase
MNRDLGGGVELEILHPANPSSSHLNNTSIVARVTYGSVAFLFTGDAETEAEQEMMARGHILRANVLKVGHHGSRTSSSIEFINAVGPTYGIMLLGDENRYGHPHQEILDRLGAANIRLYRTDIHGTIIITTDGVQLNLRTAK